MSAMPILRKHVEASAQSSDQPNLTCKVLKPALAAPKVLAFLYPGSRIHEMGRKGACARGTRLGVERIAAAAMATVASARKQKDTTRRVRTVNHRTYGI